MGNVETFKILVFAKALELKYWECEEIVFISDGATWIINMIDELFPEAIRILDKYHIIETYTIVVNLFVMMILKR
ncbi:MAG TPA: transposase [Candidatus Onthousia faecavium]|nr:transposase [Candidatus Onthousia faecavium]